MNKDSIKEQFAQEENWCELVKSWQKQVNHEDDFGHIEAELTNSVYAFHSYEWGHYGYSKADHQSIERIWDLDYDNACLIRYTVRQSDIERGPSADIRGFLSAGLDDRGYRYLGSTSDDEYGTHLTYWYLKEFCPPMENPDYNPEDEDDEPYDRWEDYDY